MRIDGACHCGAISVEGEADPDKTVICHCTDCQTGTGSAFRVSVPVPGATFEMTGQPSLYLKTTADSGNPRLQAFCPPLRLADLFDDAWRWATGMVHRARRHPAPARPPGAAAANLVALGTAVAWRTRQHPAQRDRAKRGASALAAGESGMLNRRTWLRLGSADIAGADHLSQ